MSKESKLLEALQKIADLTSNDTQDDNGHWNAADHYKAMQEIAKDAIEQNAKPLDKDHFEWTDEKVKMFVNIYATNFQSKYVDEDIFKYRKYAGKKMDEKIEQFKSDCENLKFVPPQTEFTLQEVLDKYRALSKGNKNAILYDALDFMQQSNTRSRTDCIIMAMGYELIDEENNIYRKK